MIDLTVSIMNVHGPRMGRSKRVSASDNQPIEARFRSAQKRVQLIQNTTESLVGAAWTEGGIDSLKIGGLYTPQPVPLPDRSLADWAALINENRESYLACENAPVSLSPSPRRFGSIDNDETLLDVENLFSKGFPEEMIDMAETEDAMQKKSVLDNINEQVPAV